jgi:hypothetical protein
MDLRRATLLLILGSAYTVLHKAAYGLVPALSGSRVAGTVTSILWLVATFALMLFAYEFLREIRPRDKRLRYSLILVIVFTGCVIFSKLPIRSVLTTGVGHRLLLGGASTLNSLAMVVFVASLSRLVTSGSSLRSPLRALIWGLGIEVALGLVSTGYLSTYLLTGREVRPLPFLQPLAMLLFLFTYGMTLWFLIRFWRIGSYANLLPR